MAVTQMASPPVRQPRSLVQVNGVALPCLNWEVDTNSFYQADTFRTCFVVSAMPANYGADWWAGQDQIEVEIFDGFPADPSSFSTGDLTSRFFGKADALTWDLCAGTFELYGRDLTGDLIDTKTSEKYPNQTASQVAATLAGEHGLTPVVTATKTKVGKYYEIDHVRLQDGRSEWDLLTWLAREEQFVVYVKGKELHFEAAPSATQEPYVIEYLPPSADGPPSGNWTRCTVEHVLTLAKDITVHVRSWNIKNKKGFTATARQKKVRNRVIRNLGNPTAPPQEYSYTIAGLTPEQAQKRANQLLAELSKHEVRLTVEGPADDALSITDVIQLSGTGTTLDQLFYPESIIRSFSADDGYRWRIEAKNHSPESVPQP